MKSVVSNEYTAKLLEYTAKLLKYTAKLLKYCNTVNTWGTCYTNRQLAGMSPEHMWPRCFIPLGLGSISGKGCPANATLDWTQEPIRCGAGQGAFLVARVGHQGTGNTLGVTQVKSLYGHGQDYPSKFLPTMNNRFVIVRRSVKNTSQRAKNVHGVRWALFSYKSMGILNR